MIHFSVDDTIDIFKNLTFKNYSSCFEEPTLYFFRELNKEFGIKVSFYCFYEDDNDFNLSECTDKFKEEFEENSSWLKFGFHALTRKSNYSQYDENDFLNEAILVYDELERVVSKKNLVYDVRLGFAKATKACIEKLKRRYPEFNVLYGVDDARIEYYLSEKENNILLDKGVYCDTDIGIEIKLSELRLEKQVDFKEYLKNIRKRDYYAFFTHEVHLEKPEVREKVVSLCRFDYNFIF